MDFESLLIVYFFRGLIEKFAPYIHISNYLILSMIGVLLATLVSAVFVNKFLKHLDSEMEKQTSEMLTQHTATVLGLVATSWCLLLSLLMLCLYDFSYLKPFFGFHHYSRLIDAAGQFFAFGVDGMSLLFLVLTCLLCFLSICYILKEKEYLELNGHQYFEYVLSILVLQFCLVIVFTTLNLFFFFISFEGVIVPMMYLIGYWGSRSRKIRANNMFFYYTFAGSIPLLGAVCWIYHTYGVYDIFKLYVITFKSIEQYWLFLAFFISFASKIPLFPFHIWLPEAHVEAPTMGSVLLAGILLKLGVYGFIRYNLVMFPEACQNLLPMCYAFSIFGILHASYVAIMQPDIKRVIAYSSVAHMNLVMLGMYSGTVPAIEGAVFQSVSHGFVSAAMFFIIGVIYRRGHSRKVQYYAGLKIKLAIFGTFFMTFTFANMAVPGSSSFTGEFLLFLGYFQYHSILTVIAALGVILSAAYSLFLFNRMVFGNLNTTFVGVLKELKSDERIILFTLAAFTLITGIFSDTILCFIHPLSMYITGVGVYSPHFFY